MQPTPHRPRTEPTGIDWDEMYAQASTLGTKRAASHAPPAPNKCRAILRRKFKGRSWSPGVDHQDSDFLTSESEQDSDAEDINSSDGQGEESDEHEATEGRVKRRRADDEQCGRRYQRDRILRRKFKGRSWSPGVDHQDSDFLTSESEQDSDAEDINSSDGQGEESDEHEATEGRVKRSRAGR